MRVAGGVWLLLTAATAASADSVTIATFDDPASSSLTPLFVYDAGTNRLNGGWTFPGLSLVTVGGVFDDATFSMTAAPGDGPGQVGAGSITFRNADDVPIFLIDFDSALLTVDTFGATEFNATNDVSFSGSILPWPVQAESFSFGFANQVALGNDGSFTATAAFTSSADVIPEPMTLLFVLFGVVAWGIPAAHRRVSATRP